MGFREHLEAVVNAVDGSVACSVMGFVGIAVDTYQPEARADWAQAAPGVRSAGQIYIPPAIAAVLPEEVAVLARELLALDLQPAYQAADAGRVYGMTIAGWNLRWRMAGETVEVVAAEPMPSGA